MPLSRRAIPILAVGLSIAFTLTTVCAQEPAPVESDSVVAARAEFERAMEFAGEGKFREALEPAEKAVRLFEAAFGPEHGELIQPLLLVGNMRRESGNLKGTEQANLRALAIAEKTLGENDAETATVLNNLGVVYRLLGVFSKARPYYERALAVRQNVLGPEHPDTGQLHTNLGILLREIGEYEAARIHLQRGFEIAEHVYGAEHQVTGVSVGMLAMIDNAIGDYADAERLYIRAIAIHEHALGPEHRTTITSINNLASHYLMTGAYDKAEPLLRRAYEVRMRSNGLDHPDTLSSVANLGSLYVLKGDTKQARPFYEQFLESSQRVYVADSDVVSRAYGYIANLEMAEGHLDLAERNFRKALEAREAQLGPDHPKTADGLASIGAIYLARGQFEAARPFLDRALAIDERTLGVDHPMTVSALRKRGELWWATGNIDEAVDAFRRSNDGRERELVRNLTTGSEQRKLSYLEMTADELDRTITLHQASARQSLKAANAALEIILRRKGRALDAMTGQIESLRHRASAEDRALLNDLSAAQAEYARVTLSGSAGPAPMYRDDLDRLTSRIEQLETKAADRSAEFRASALPVTLEGVREGIPAGSVLVEFAVYAPFDPKTRTSAPKRYTAYTLDGSGRIAWVDLGIASEMDALVSEVRSRLRSGTDEQGLRRASRALDERLLRPVRRLLGTKTDRLIVAPDGVLNLVPFSALVDETGHYAVETREIVYLSSGRELLRLRPGSPGLRGKGVAIVANPDFGSATGTGSLLQFRPLPGTAAEAAAIARLLPGARLMTGLQATESAIKRTDAPAILHIATHGFFLDAKPEDRVTAEVRRNWEATRDVVQVSSPAAAAPAAIVASSRESLVRSGLGLSGANRAHAGGEDDGLLTALEAAGLNLWGTELVVLSACDTSVGVIRDGNGVYSLRRALTLAGAEAQLTSLWPVSDRGTRELMVAYYGELLAGRGRSEALRVTQLAMLKDPKRRHPFYWAGFVPSGAWWPLSLKKEHG